MAKKCYQELSSLLIAIDNCRKANNLEWLGKHEERLNDLIRNCMPSGSGFDIGTKLWREKSTADRLVFTTSFHHMNDVGFYDGWTDHIVTITPSLFYDFNIKISGRDRGQIKDYIHEVFDTSLRTEV